MNVVPTTVNYSQNVFLKAVVLPSSYNRTIHLVSGLLATKISDLKLKDIVIKIDSLGIDYELTNIKFGKVTVNKSDTAILTQIVGDTFNVSFPKANVTLDFNYLFKLGNKSDVRTGNATLNGTGIGINMTIKTFVNETDPGTG